MQPSSREILFGCDEPAEAELQLQAGPLAMTLRGIRLLGLRHGNAEIWHEVGFVFRDPDWFTPQPLIERLEHEQHADSFDIRIDARIPVQPPVLVHIRIQGSAHGRVRYEASAVAQGDIATNRSGICVMHPLDAVDHAVTVTHADGRESHSTFPRRIAPWPPFMSVQAIRHEWTPGAWAQCRLEGDVFELEDQRNNADASFKTYNRSNMMPRPYRLRAGQTVTQAADLRLVDHGASAEHVQVSVQKAPDVSPATPASRLAFSIGIGISPSDCHASESVLLRLSELRPGHLHLHLESPDQAVHWPGLRALLLASHAKLRVDVAMGNAEPRTALNGLAVALRKAGLQAEAVAIFPSTPAAIEAAQKAFPDCSIGGGTLHFFTQLNRAEDLGELDFLSFTTSALVHGADDDAIMQGLRSLPFMLETLSARYPGVPVRIGPSAIPARASPIGGQPESDGTRRLALAQRDPRTRALFGAAWAVGYLAHLQSAGLKSVTLMQLRGHCGLLQGDEALPVPAWFVLQALQGAQQMGALSGLPGGTCGLHVRTHAGRQCWVANLTSRALTLDIAQTFDGCLGADVMDEASIRYSGSKPPWRTVNIAENAKTFDLAPYAVLRVRT
jgi:hypothetical protein